MKFQPTIPTRSRENRKNLIFGHKRAQNFFFGFFGENRASSLFYTYNRLTCCKKSEKSNDGKYENFCHRGERGERDGSNFKGPKCWSNNLSFYINTHIYLGETSCRRAFDIVVRRSTLRSSMFGSVWWCACEGVLKRTTSCRRRCRCQQILR